MTINKLYEIDWRKQNNINITINMLLININMLIISNTILRI